jgi:hypothetical protein
MFAVFQKGETGALNDAGNQQDKTFSVMEIIAALVGNDQVGSGGTESFHERVLVRCASTISKQQNLG